AFVGVDIGTSSSKGVAVSEVGRVISRAEVLHDVARPCAGWAEHSAEEVWWGDFCTITRQLLERVEPSCVEAICISGLGPCVLLTNRRLEPIRGAILYGIDTRATAEIEEITEELGLDAILSACGSFLTTQAIGPKLRWIAKNDWTPTNEDALLFTSSNY